MPKIYAMYMVKTQKYNEVGLFLAIFFTTLATFCRPELLAAKISAPWQHWLFVAKREGPRVVQAQHPELAVYRMSLPPFSLFSLLACTRGWNSRTIS
jgi:hypothetical protein